MLLLLHKGESNETPILQLFIDRYVQCSAPLGTLHDVLRNNCNEVKNFTEMLVKTTQRTND